MNARLNGLALVMAAFSVAPVWAQAQDGSAPTSGHAQHQQGATSPAPAVKQDDASAMQGMNHGDMKMQGDSVPAKQDAMQGMDHGNMKMQDSSAPVNKDSMPGMGGMGSRSSGSDSGMAGMQSQGSSAPADARDPHAYSGGYTLDKGPYALPGSQRLRLGDEHNFGSVLFDRLERAYNRNGNATVYDAQAWFGRDYDRLVIKAEGNVAKGKVQEARTEVLWGHAIASFWDTQLGVRYDSGIGPDRGWLAFGVQGIAPYWFNVNAAAYVGNNGRTALRLAAEYELLLTQKLILQPRAEINIYGKNDEARDIGSGLSNGTVGLRLRYEINRQFAPYIGVERSNALGNTADLVRAAGEPTGKTLWVAGVRMWF